MRNSASFGGGALYIQTTTNIPVLVSLSKCNFIDNVGMDLHSSGTITFGGAVHISSFSRLPISLSEYNFTNNTAADRGGAVYLQVASSPILIAQSYFTINRLRGDSSDGGAVYISGDDNMVSVHEGVFINNTVLEGSGGALFSWGEQTNFSFVNVLAIPW